MIASLGFLKHIALIFSLVAPEKWLSKQSWRRWFETPTHSLWCHFIVCMKSTLDRMRSPSLADMSYMICHMALLTNTKQNKTRAIYLVNRGLTFSQDKHTISTHRNKALITYANTRTKLIYVSRLQYSSNIKCRWVKIQKSASSYYLGSLQLLHGTEALRDDIKEWLQLLSNLNPICG